MTSEPTSAPALAAVDFGQGITDAWSAIATFVPRLLGFLVVLLIGWVIAKAVSKIVDKVLDRVGFNRVVERGGINRMLAKSKYDASDIIAKLIYYAILLITLQIAFGVFGDNPVSDVLTGIVAWLPGAVVAIVIIVVAGAVARAVKDLISNGLGGLSYGPLLGTLASVFIWGLGVIAALHQIGVADAITQPVLIAVLATIAGVAIVGLGGGLVRPMQSRWDRWLNRAEDEIPQARAMNEARQRGSEDAARATADTARPAGERVSVPTGQAAGGQRGGGMPGTAPPRGPEPGGQMPPSAGGQLPQPDQGYPQPGGYPGGRQPPGSP